MRPFWLLTGVLCVACNAAPALQSTTEAGNLVSALPTDAGTVASESASLNLRLSESSLTRPALVRLKADVPSGTSRVVFYRDGQQLAEDRSAPFEAQAVFARRETTTYQLSFRAFTASGRSRTSGRVPLAVNIAGRVLYVSPTGTAANDGLSEAAPLQTIQSAMNLTRPGDTVLVKDGTYSQPEYPTGDVVTIRTSGTADAWIALMAYPGQKPKIRSVNWQGVRVDGAAYLIIQGLTIEGNRDAVTLEQALASQNDLNNPATSGNGINVAPSFEQPELRSHHVVIRGNTVYKCPGSGIGTSQADYVTIEDNVVWGNAFYSPYAGSGVTTYQNWNSDDANGVKMIIRRNVIYDNQNKVPFYFSDEGNPERRVITDGNGVIIDDSRNTQFGSRAGAYRGRTLVENNVVYNNGARGIHVYSSDHVDILNNTTFRNSFQPETPEGEVTAFDASDVRVFNNVLLPRADRPAIRRTFADPTEQTSQVFRRNLISGGLKPDPSLGSGQNFIVTDPKLTDLAARNFRPLPGSPAIDAGDAYVTASEDIDLTRRPLGLGVDIGAYEVR